MQSTKSQSASMDVNVFLALWIGAYVLVYLLLYTADTLYWTFVNLAPTELALQMTNLQQWRLVGFLLMALLYGLVLSSIQLVLMRRYFGFSVAQWFRMSLIGWIVGGCFAYYVEPLRYPAFTYDGFVLSLLAFWMPAALLQAMQIRRATKQWWLWIVMNLVALFLFALTYILVDGTKVLVLLKPIGFIPAAIIQGAITAGALFQMFPQADE